MIETRRLKNVVIFILTMNTFLERRLLLRKPFNEELADVLDFYDMFNLSLNIFKVLKNEIHKKEYKNKHKFL